jgi:hypothetical protein
MNWKDSGDGSRSMAWAVRAVGGKYEIIRYGGPKEMRQAAQPERGWNKHARPEP